jgi:transcriptional regulator with XRE-family HTH domain
MDIGARMREVRKDLGMPQAELARRAGTSRNHIVMIEAGSRTPSMALLERIAHELHTEPAELLREPVPLVGAPSDTGHQTIAVGRPDVEGEYGPPPTLEHRYDEAFDRAVAELRNEGLGDVGSIAAHMHRYARRLEAAAHE